MRSEVQYEAGQTVTFRMPRTDERTFAPSAATSVIGKCPPLTQPDGTVHDSEVIAAYVENGDLFITLRVGEPQ